MLATTNENQNKNNGSVIDNTEKPKLRNPHLQKIMIQRYSKKKCIFSLFLIIFLLYILINVCKRQLRKYYC